jgi:protocatechuate 3,4-dioxygenase beta subunit
LATTRGGYLLKRSATIDVAPGVPPPGPVILELVRGAQVSGRVVDARGAPVAAARVLCIASAMEDLTVQTGPLPLAVEAAATAGGQGRALESTRAAPTDRAGKFTVDDLIPGRYRLEVSHPGLEPLRTDEVTLAPGARREVGTLALRAGFPVEGRVLDDAGNPIEGARVSAAASGAAEAAELYALTDGGGNFALALPAGHYRVAAGAPGHGTAQAPVEVRPDASAPKLELRLARAEAFVEGLVSDVGGRPLARARIVAWAKDDGPASAGRPIGQTTADVGGHFRLTDLPAGELRIEVQHPDYPPTTLTASTGRYASLTIPFPGAIAGEAHVRSTGVPVGRGRVEAAGPDGARATADIQRAGSFRLRRLVPGHWRLSVTAPGFRPAEKELEVPPSPALGEASVSGLRVELDPT